MRALAFIPPYEVANSIKAFFPIPVVCFRSTFILGETIGGFFKSFVFVAKCLDVFMFELIYGLSIVE